MIKVSNILRERNEKHYRIDFLNLIKQNLRRVSQNHFAYVCEHYIPHFQSCSISNDCMQEKCKSFLPMICDRLEITDRGYYCKKRREKRLVLPFECAECFLQEKGLVKYDGRKKKGWFRSTQYWKINEFGHCLICDRLLTCEKEEKPLFEHFKYEITTQKNRSIFVSLDCSSFTRGSLTFDTSLPYGMTRTPYICPYCNRPIKRVNRKLTGCRLCEGKYFQWYHGKCFTPYFKEHEEDPSPNIVTILL